ncbi:MAG: NAD+ synthase [Candidatus Aminicenantes bacterium]|nr:NAD+ synthase [Candidatus Aminicenantes bacterium]
MKIDAPFVERILAGFIKDKLAKAGFRKGILGLSGGLDSAVCAHLAVKALGPGNVIALLMPYGRSFGDEIEDALDVARRLRLRAETIDIAPIIDAYFERYPTGDRVRRGNKMARERMSILYDVSAREKALILGTSNKTELLLGYGTIHGDMACAINPLGDLYKTQVRELAAHLGVPEGIRTKPPTAGLWPGQTDEAELGLTYEEADEILFRLVEERASAAEVAAAGYPKARVEKIAAMIRASEFKRHLPPIAKISPRTVGHDFLYPYDRSE